MSSGVSMSMGLMVPGMKLGCSGSVMSQYPMPSRLTMGMASLALVHKCVVLVSGCPNNPNHWLLMNSTGLKSPLGVTIKTYMSDFIYSIRCTDTGVIATHALSFYQPLAPFVWLTHVQLAVVTQSCALLYIAAHCDLLLQ